MRSIFAGGGDTDGAHATIPWPPLGPILILGRNTKDGRARAAACRAVVRSGARGRTSTQKRPGADEPGATASASGRFHDRLAQLFQDSTRQ